MSSKATFSEKIAVTQDTQGRFFANLGYDVELNLASLDIKHCVSRFPLREDCLFPGKGHDLPACADSGKEFLRVKVASFLGRNGCCHQCFSCWGYTLQ